MDRQTGRWVNVQIDETLMAGWMDKQISGEIDRRWMDGWKDQQTDRRTHGQMDE